MTMTLLVPGLDGSPQPHWQHWWAATEQDAMVVDLSFPDCPMPAIWEMELASAVLAHPGCVLVGHSLGAVLIARLLDGWPHLPVRAAMLVAPAETQGNDRIGHFGPIPERSLGVPALVVASRNDPWMSFARAAALSAAWGSALVDAGAAGHLNADSGLGPWPEGRRLRDRLLAAPARPVVLAAAPETRIAS